MSDLTPNPIKITGKSNGKALEGIHFNGDIVHRWSLKRVKADTLTYEATCVRFSDARGDVRCHINGDEMICHHVVDALDEALWLCGFETSDTGRPVRITNDVGAFTLSYIRRRQNSNPLANLTELIDAKCLALEPGHTMPIGYKVQLYRRKDDVLVFENGSKRSKPVARLGRDYNYRGVRHEWKMAADARQNWEEFKV